MRMVGHTPGSQLGSSPGPALLHGPGILRCASALCGSLAVMYTYMQVYVCFAWATAIAVSAVQYILCYEVAIKNHRVYCGSDESIDLALAESHYLI